MAGQERAASENRPPLKCSRCACPAAGGRGHRGEPLLQCSHHDSGPRGQEGRLLGTPAVQGAVGSIHRVPGPPWDLTAL